MNTNPKIHTTKVLIRMAPTLKQDIRDEAWRRRLSASEFIRQSCRKALSDAADDEIRDLV